MSASDILHHLLAEKGVTPDSYRDTFRQAGERSLLPEDLSVRSQEAAGMRNILMQSITRFYAPALSQR